MKAATVGALIVSLAGGAVASQAPELAQQYRQRLGGALEEVAHVVADFDADAARNNLRREEALALHDQAEEPFLRDRGQSIRRTIARFERLRHQSKRLGELPPVLRPLAVIAAPDQAVLEGTVRNFEPAVPLTAHGLAWTAVGLLSGFGVFRLAAFPFRRRASRRPGRYGERFTRPGNR